MSESTIHLESWLRDILGGGIDFGRLAHVGFPSDELLAEYLADVENRTEVEVKSLLRRMLSATTSRADTDIYQLLLNTVHDGEISAVHEFGESYYRLRRRTEFEMGDAWEGMTWVLEFLPFKPGLALRALDLYVEAQHGLPDLRIHALSDASAIIRARWIGNISSRAGRVSLLKTFTPRQFEGLVASLWETMGYQTTLTPSSADGGYDLRAMKVLAERRDIVLVECKRTNSRPIGVKTIRELNGLLDHERSVRGVIVTTTKFTRGARKFVRDNSRLNLVDGDALVLMMNEHLGWDWPRRADLLVRLALQNNDGHDSVPDQRLDR